MKNLIFTIVACTTAALCMAQHSQNKSDFGGSGFDKMMLRAKEIQQFEKSVCQDAQTVKSFSDNYDYGNPPDWTRVDQFGGSGADHANDIITDADGNIFLAGAFSGEIGIGDSSYTSVGNRDAYVAKFNPSGSLLWFRQMSASPDKKIEAKAIHIDDQGKLYVTGYYTGEVIIGGVTLENPGDKSIFMIELNQNGEYLMVKNFYGIGGVGLCIKTDFLHNIYIIASSLTDISYYISTVVLKFDPNFNYLNDLNVYQNIMDMLIYNQKIYYLGAIINPGYLGEFYFNPDLNDVFIARSDLNFNFEWATMAQHNNYGSSYGTNLTLQENDLYITGIFHSDIIWGSTEINYGQGFIGKFSLSGNIEWLSPVINQNYSSYNHYPSIIAGNSNIYTFYRNLLFSYDINTGLFCDSYEINDSPKCMAMNNTGNQFITAGENNELINMVCYDNLEPQWDLNFTGNSAHCEIIGMALDQFGFLYVYGYASNPVDYFGHTTERGAFLARQSPMGIIQWIKCFSGIQEQQIYIGNYITIDTVTNNVYITHNFEDPVKIPAHDTLYPGENGSIFILKYDYSGNLKYLIQEDFSGEYLGITPDHSGNVIFNGTFYDSATLGNEFFVANGRIDFFVAKYNSVGNFEWAIQAGGDEAEYECYAGTDNADNIYFVGGYYSSQIQIGNYSLDLPEGAGDIVLSKIDPDGQVYWAKSKGGSPVPTMDNYGWPTGLKTDSEGTCYVKGWYGDSASFDNYLLVSPYRSSSKFIAKFDPDGNTSWANPIIEHSYGSDYNQMDIDQPGNVYLGMTISDTISFGDVYTYNKPDPFSFSDLFIAKYSSQGALDWVKFILCPSTSYLSSATVTNPSGIFIGGYFNNSITFQDIELKSDNRHGFVALIGEASGIDVYNRASANASFSIYPNPAVRKADIEFELQNKVPVSVAIYNLTGQFIESVICGHQEPGKHQMSINIENYKPGVYYLQLNAGKQTWIQKLIKIK